ncbi:MAG: hypothetical protein AB4426_00360 [Xenococcaceae cyanobacterium]
MKRIASILIIALSIGLFVVALPALALDFEVGQKIELKARNPAGVPLHRRSQ